MKRLARTSLPAAIPAWLPNGARIVQAAKPMTRAVVKLGNRPLVSLIWDHLGMIQEYELDAKGRHHGLEIERFDDGRPKWIAEWVRHKQHGLVMQLDERGRPAMITEFERGRGVDIWLDDRDGRGFAVAEVRHCAGGIQHGWVRSGDPRRPGSEEYYDQGLRHGVFRRWKDDALEHGFPQFFVHDKQVSREVYDAARARDRSLPAYEPREDRARRPMPPVVSKALDRAKRVRRVLAARSTRLAGRRPSADELELSRELAMLDKIARHAPLRPLDGAAKPEPAKPKSTKPAKPEPAKPKPAKPKPAKPTRPKTAKPKTAKKPAKKPPARRAGSARRAK